MLASRLIFGTARISGGACQPEADRLLRLAFEGGIRHFDTAPSYGGGTAERAIGKAFHGRTDLSITTKVGLARPEFAVAKTWGRAFKRAIRPTARRLDGSFEPVSEDAGAATHGKFDLDFVNRSLIKSCRNLQRNTIDLLLLHEAYADDANSPILEWLDQRCLAGQVRAIGYSYGPIFGPLANAAFPANYVAQCAVDPSWFECASITNPLSQRPLILHSIAQTADWAVRVNPALRARFDRATNRLPSMEHTTALIAVAIAVLCNRLPTARFILSSTNARRFEHTLAALAEIDVIGCEAIARVFDNEVRCPS